MCYYFYQVHLHLKIMLIFICLFIFEKKTFIWFRCISWNIDLWMCTISWNPRKIPLYVIFISSTLINYHDNAPDNPYVTWQLMIDQKSNWHIWGEMNTCHRPYQYIYIYIYIYIFFFFKCHHLKHSKDCNKAGQCSYLLLISLY